MKTRILRTLSMMIAMALLLMSLPAMAAENPHDGKMEITIGNNNSKFYQGEIELSAYLIARGDYGDWTPVKEFADITITSRDDGSAWISSSMKQIKQRIKDLKIQPVKSAKSHKNGKTNLNGLEHGIYYVAMTKGNGENITITPMLLSTPDKSKSVEVTAIAKYEYTPPEEDEETPPDEPTIPRGPVPVPPKVPMIIVPTRRGERLVDIDEYKTALGLGNIQIHVGVCYE